MTKNNQIINTDQVLNDVLHVWKGTHEKEISAQHAFALNQQMDSIKRTVVNCQNRSIAAVPTTFDISKYVPAKHNQYIICVNEVFIFYFLCYYLNDCRETAQKTYSC